MDMRLLMIMIIFNLNYFIFHGIRSKTMAKRNVHQDITKQMLKNCNVLVQET